MSFVAFCGAVGFLISGPVGCAVGVIVGALIIGVCHLL